MQKRMFLARAVLCACWVYMNSLTVSGHGLLWEPPSRATMFRTGEFPGAPKNFDDNGLNCGGRWNLIQNGGKCGVCGDPWQGPRDNEAGGTFARGVIVRTYKMGQVVDVAIEITANHLGYVDFRLCPVNDALRAATWECLNQHVLHIVGHGDKYYIGNTHGVVNMKIQLPPDVVCTQCVFQWRYHAGNSWGVAKNGTGCLGCGYQEEFYACADIAIATRTPVQTPQPTSPVEQTYTPIIPGQPVIGLKCRAINAWAKSKIFDIWCENNCSSGNCPSMVCACQ